MEGKYECKFCDRSFITNLNLLKHESNAHGVKLQQTKRDLKCEVCDKQFTSVTNRNKHVRKFHGVTYTCEICVNVFKTQSDLFYHVRNHQNNAKENGGNPIKGPKVVQCDDCRQNFFDISTMRRHKQRKHAGSDSCAVPKLVCPLCDHCFLTYALLHEHLQKGHDFRIETSSLDFSSLEEFEAWKTTQEKDVMASFVKRSSKGNISYYVCHRSGARRGNFKGAERIGWRETQKIDKCCPARMKVTTNEKRILVEYASSHAGHFRSVKYLRLSKEERSILAGKIKNGVTFDHILDEICNNVATKHEVHIIDKQDLQTVVRDSDLDTDQVHSNDALSVDMWVEDQKALGADSPVLYYKPQGIESRDSILNKDDFMLVLMTPHQKEEISKFAMDKTCIDSTHGTTGHDFQTTTLLTVDEFGAGVPVAECISNRIDSMSMVQFFTLVRNVTGEIRSKVFMSDDSPAYINAWIEVMGQPDQHVLCTWYVDENWRQSLNKIKDPMRQSEVYKSCRMLLELTDKEEFEELLFAFLSLCNENPDTKAFGEYFRSTYANQPQQWAFCYRLQMGFNTNMYLEALHKKLKYCYMDGKKNRRVDKIIALLLRLTRDIIFDRMIRMAKNEPTFRMHKIAESHKRSEEVADSMVRQLKSYKWSVDSKHESRGRYTVCITSDEECNGCPLACPECKVCVHQFTCTCVDHLIKGNMCKHVHACIRVKKKADLHRVLVLEDEFGVAETTIETTWTEEDGHTSFQQHSQSLVTSSQCVPVLIQEAVSERQKLQTLLETISGIAANASDEIIPELRQEAELFLLRAQKLCLKTSEEMESGDTLHFITSSSVQPIHANIERQRFYSTKRKSVAPKRTISKLTGMQEVGLKEAIKRNIVTNVHTDFDHVYWKWKSPKKETKLSPINCNVNA